MCRTLTASHLLHTHAWQNPTKYFWGAREQGRKAEGATSTTARNTLKSRICGKVWTLMEPCKRTARTGLTGSTAAEGEFGRSVLVFPSFFRSAHSPFAELNGSRNSHSCESVLDITTAQPPSRVYRQCAEGVSPAGRFGKATGPLGCRESAAGSH